MDLMRNQLRRSVNLLGVNVSNAEISLCINILTTTIIPCLKRERERERERGGGKKTERSDIEEFFILYG